MNRPDEDVPQDGPPRFAALMLGIDIEETYCLFGEQTQTLLGGVSDEMYETFERKFDRMQRTLEGLEADPALGKALSPFMARIERGMEDAPTDEKEIEQVIADSHQTAGEIGALMGRIRKALDDRRGLEYDAGVFLARLSLCARMVRAAAQADNPTQLTRRTQEIYLKELARASGAFLGIMLQADKSGLFGQVFAPDLADPLVQLGRECAQETKDAENAAKIEAIIEGVLSKVGMGLADSGF